MSKGKHTKQESPQYRTIFDDQMRYTVPEGIDYCLPTKDNTVRDKASDLPSASKTLNKSEPSTLFQAMHKFYTTFVDNYQTIIKEFDIKESDNLQDIFREHIMPFECYAMSKSGKDIRIIAGGNEFWTYFIKYEHKITNNLDNSEIIRVSLLTLHVFNMMETKNTEYFNYKLLDKFEVYQHPNTKKFQLIIFDPNAQEYINKKEDKRSFLQSELLRKLQQTLGDNVSLYNSVFQQKTIIEAYHELQFIANTIDSITHNANAFKHIKYEKWQDNTGMNALSIDAMTDSQNAIVNMRQKTIKGKPDFSKVVIPNSVNVSSFHKKEDQSSLILDFIAIMQLMQQHWYPQTVDENASRISVFKRALRKKHGKEIKKAILDHIITYVRLCAIYIRIKSVSDSVTSISESLTNRGIQSDMKLYYFKQLEVYSVTLKKYEDDICAKLTSDLTSESLNVSQKRPFQLMYFKPIASKNASGRPDLQLTDIEYTIYSALQNYIIKHYNVISDDLKNTLSPFYTNLLTTFHASIQQTTDVIGLTALFKDDLDESIESLEVLFSNKTKDIYKIVVKTLALNDNKKILDSETEKIYKAYVGVINQLYALDQKSTVNDRDTLRKNLGSSPEIDWDTLRENLGSSPENMSQYKSISEYFSSPDIYVKLIGTYEALSGSVRVFVKIKDYKLTTNVYNPNSSTNNVFQMIKKNHWISKEHHIGLIDDSKIVIGNTDCFKDAKCEHIEYGPFYRVIPPYYAGDDKTFKKMDLNAMMTNYMNTDNILQLFSSEAPKPLYLTLFTYGYSGSGKTYTLFGPDKNGGIIGELQKKVNMQLVRYFTLYGFLTRQDNVLFLQDQYHTKEAKSISEIFTSVNQPTSKITIDNFIKATPNNKDSSRGFVFFEYTVNFKHKLVVVDMAGNEDPTDILLTTVPSYHIPYLPSQLNATYIESSTFTEIDLFAKMISQTIITNIFLAVKLSYKTKTAISNINNSDEQFLKRMLGHSAKNTRDKLPELSDMPLNTSDNTIFYLLRMISNNYEKENISYDMFYNLDQLQVMKNLLGKLSFLKKSTTYLNFSYYNLIFDVINYIYDDKISKATVNNTKHSDTVYEKYNKELDRLKMTQIMNKSTPFRTNSKSNPISVEAKTIIIETAESMLNKIKNTLGIEDSPKLFLKTSMESDKKQNLMVFVNSSEFYFDLICLYEIHKQILTPLTSYIDLIPNNIFVSFGQEHFATLNGEPNDSEIMILRNSLYASINKLYASLPKGQAITKDTGSVRYEDKLNIITMLSGVLYTIDFYLKYKDVTEPQITDDFERLTVISRAETGAGKDNMYKMQNVELDMDDRVRKDQKHSEYINTKTKDFLDLIIKQYHGDENIYDAIHAQFKKITTKSLVNDTKLQDIFKSFKVPILIHREESYERFDETKEYFKRIVMEGYYINQVNHELVMLLKAMREKKEINIQKELNRGKHVLDKRTMYGYHYDSNKHLNRITDIQNKYFRMTSFYHVMNEMLDLNKKDEIDHKFFMIANISPEEDKYRQGAIHTLDLMQQLAE